LNHIAIIRVLSYMGLALGGTMVLPLLVALLYGETSQIMAFSIVLLLTLMLAAMCLQLTSAPERRSHVNDALAVAVLWCIGAPIPAAVPFVFGTAEPSIIAGLHEAVACLTTTGHSVIDLDGNNWPVSLLVWRGVLHCVGMVFSLVLAASVFAALSFGGPGIQRSVLFTIPDGSFFDAIPRVLRAVIMVCLSLIGIVFSALLFTGVQPGEAMGIAISVASTGLVDPNHNENIVQGGPAVFIVFSGLVLATSGLAVLMNLSPKRLRFAAVDAELFLLVGLIGLLGLLAWLGGVDVFKSLSWAVSSISTSGLSLGISVDEIKSTLPVTVLVLPALIGGAALSTAGGIKLARIIILLRRAGQEFAQLGFQNSVVALRYRNRQQKQSAVLGVWVYLIAYIAAVSLVFVCLSFLGEGFGSSMSVAVGAISNSGWLIDLGDASNGLEHSVVMFGMILGRLEILALLPTLNPAFWRA
jgi:Trk-type K+ transport system membrane component